MIYDHGTRSREFLPLLLLRHAWFNYLGLTWRQSHGRLSPTASLRDMFRIKRSSVTNQAPAQPQFS